PRARSVPSAGVLSPCQPGSSLPSGGALFRSPLDELLEERPVVVHRLTQVLGRGTVVVFALEYEPVAGSVVLHDLRMIRREIGSTLLEVLDRIPALGHELLEERVGRGHGS